MSSPTQKHQFQGSQVARISSDSGLYAWYYKPAVIDRVAIIQILHSFLDVQPKLSTQIEMRYGLKLISQSSLIPEFGAQKQTALEIITQAIEKSDSFFDGFFSSHMLEAFSRPIYIGIAKNLNQRIYHQHYLSLVSMYDTASPVNRFLEVYSNATAQDVMSNLDIPHSFALEARARKIAPRDLSVNIFCTQLLPDDIGADSDDLQIETPARRALEKLLQLISDPICGRQ